ncbi:MAG TPA: YkgJ family cysteine cluster protein [Pantanalinema sp.]
MDAAHLKTVIRQSRQLLDKVGNVGQSGQWDDLYTVLDYLCFAFSQAYPTLPCKAGCSHCCEEILFRVSELEWRAIARHLDSTLSIEVREALKEQARAVYAPHRAQLEALSAFWAGSEFGEEGAPHEGLPVRCAFLDEEGRCGVYEVRPVVCRAYGSFGVTLGQQPTMLICQTFGPAFIQELTVLGEETLTLAPVEVFYQKLEELEPGARVAPMPLWLLRWAENQ